MIQGLGFKGSDFSGHTLSLSHTSTGITYALLKGQ